MCYFSDLPEALYDIYSKVNDDRLSDFFNTQKKVI